MSRLKLKVKQLFARYVSALSPRVYFTLSYVHNRKRIPNFSHPRDLSEFAIKRILDGDVNKIYYLADKFEVRKYIEGKGLSSILTPLLGVYEDANEIDFSTLPSKFALKANYGAGMNFICTDNSKIDTNEVRKLVQKWLDNPQEYSFSERHYNLIPHKIICEEFIDDGNGGFPTDYKFLCINGKARCVLACNGRETRHAHYAHYSMNWEFVPEYDKLHRAAGRLPKPRNFDEMIQVAEKLADGIGLVRIDLYSNGSKIWFGEMTLTPAGCIFHGWSKKALKDMGKFFIRNS